jgi:hypothetical protein
VINGFLGLKDKTTISQGDGMNLHNLQVHLMGLHGVTRDHLDLQSHQTIFQWEAMVRQNHLDHQDHPDHQGRRSHQVPQDHQEGLQGEGTDDRILILMITGPKEQTKATDLTSKGLP